MRLINDREATINGNEMLIEAKAILTKEKGSKTGYGKCKTKIR